MNEKVEVPGNTNKDLIASEKVITDQGVYQVGSVDPVGFDGIPGAISAADIKPFLNGEPLDNLQELKYEIAINPPGIDDKIEGRMIFCLILDSVMNKLPKDKFDLDLKANTEFGARSDLRFEGVRITGYRSRVSIDDAVIEEILTFEADSCKPFTESKLPIGGLRS